MARLFSPTSTPEPHASRRVEILKKHPEIKTLFGYDKRTTWATIAVFVMHLSTAWVVSQITSYLWETEHHWVAASLFVCAAFLIGSILMHWLAMSIHESSHNLAARTPMQNRVLALFANIPCLVPISMSFHRYHLEHHLYLGVDDGDADLPVSIEVRTIGNNSLKKFLWLFFNLFTYVVRGVVYGRRPNRWEVINFVVQTVALFVLWHYLGGLTVGYLALSIFFGMGIHPVAAHFIHEHYTFEPGQETYSYYGPLNYVTYNVGYHYEHHDFMNVPGSRLPELKRMASEYYDGLVSHGSWAWVHWHFITNSKMGIGSRIVRTREVFEHGRRLSRPVDVNP